VSSLVPPERDGILLVSVVVAKDDEDGLDGESQMSQDVGRNWIVLRSVILRAESGAVNVGCVLSVAAWNQLIIL
jgi:hypothetical protein